MANVWRENPDIGQTLRTLCGSGADVIGCNEAAGWISDLETCAHRYGYRVHFEPGHGRPGRQNPVLLHDHVKVLSVDTWTISQAVGRSPERTATAVTFELHGYVWTVICLHANSHVQEGPDNPHELPRVREWVDGMQSVLARINAERRKGRRVLVVGDLNWAWDRARDRWKYSPERMFRQEGMVAQFADPSAPRRPRGDRRPIEYVVYHPDDLVIAGQRMLRPERSDHPLHEVTFHIKENR